MYPNLQRHSSHGDRVKHGSHGDRQFIVSLQKFPQERSEKVNFIWEIVSYSDTVIGFRIFFMLMRLHVLRLELFYKNDLKVETSIQLHAYQIILPMQKCENSSIVTYIFLLRRPFFWWGDILEIWFLKRLKSLTSCDCLIFVSVALLFQILVVNILTNFKLKVFFYKNGNIGSRS